MSDTPETDLAVRGSNGQWSFGLRDLCERLERQRNSYAETLREIAELGIWLADIPLADIIRKLHPEMGNTPALPPTVGSGES